MKLLIRTLILFFIFTYPGYCGAAGKTWKALKSGVDYFGKKVPKSLANSSKLAMQKEIKYFNKEKDKLLNDLKAKKKRDKKKNKEKDKAYKKSISLASWNLHNISVNTKEYKLKRVNEYIRRLSTIQMTDIVFLQELKDSKNTKLLNDETLSKNDRLKTYQYIPFISSALGENNHKERYAILIHPKFLIKIKKLGRSPQIIPIKLKSYKRFKRPPYGLKIGKDLLVLNVHLGHYGNSNESLLMRKNEAKELKKSITRLMKKHNTKHIIIGGDFNLDSIQLRKIFKTPKYKVTTEKNTTNKNSYDHIITTLPVKSDLVSWIDRDNISDHSPIRIKVDLKHSKKIKKI